MAEPNIFELADLDAKADKEKGRQALEFKRLGVEPPAEANLNVFHQAAAELAKEPKKEDEKGLLSRAFGMVRGAAPSTIGALLGAAGGAASPIPGGTLIGESLGGMGGEWLGQKMGWSDPSKLSIALSGAAPGLGKLVAPAWQLAKEGVISTIASRPLVAQAAEGLLKKWLNPAAKAADLYEQAGKLTMQIPADKTFGALDDVLKKEINRAPTEIRERILEAVRPLRNYFQAPTQSVTQAATPVLPKGKSLAVPELMEEVQRLRSWASKAYQAGDDKFANVINSIRASMLDDLEKGGAGVVKEASRAYRKEMALEDLGRMIAKNEPGTKIRDFARSNPLFKGAFDAKEMALIDKVAKKVTFVAPTGGSGVIGRAITTGAGFGAGGVWGAVIGAAGPEAVRKMLASPKGQRFIEKTLEGGYSLGPEYAAAMAAFARGLAAQAVGTGGEQ